MLTLRKITASEYEAMYESGILSEDERLELIEGEIHTMQAIGKNHFVTVDRLSNQFKSYLQNQVIVRVQNPLHLSETFVPQPDLCLLNFRADYYAETDPKPEDINLVIEVADSSLEYDRNYKLPLYAEAGLAEVWIVNLKNKQLELYRNPKGRDYLLRLLVKTGDAVAPLAFPELEKVWL
ncbi:MAG: Uma2 family endonuclease [Trueperaceae bacterium]|nr:Uma2 family endonuclease [Trueperaceae bacterium]